MKKMLTMLIVLLFICSQSIATLLPTLNIYPFETARIIISPTQPIEVNYLVTRLGLTVTNSIGSYSMRFAAEESIVFDISFVQTISTSTTRYLVFDTPTLLRYASPSHSSFLVTGEQITSPSVGPGFLFTDVYISGTGKVDVYDIPTPYTSVFLGSFIITPEPVTMILLGIGFLFLRKK